LEALPAEQLAFASAVSAGTRIGFVMLLATFLVYALGVLQPEVPVSELPRYWHLPVAEYVRVTGAPTGWDWLRHLAAGDVLNFVGIAVLALVTPVGYVRVLAVLLGKGGYRLALICAAQLVVFALAVLATLSPL
jgi:hypothetical protein